MDVDMCVMEGHWQCDALRVRKIVMAYMLENVVLC